jgi:hypothetical protein
MWVSTCLLGFFIEFLLLLFYKNKNNFEEKYRNNIKKILRNLKNDLLSILYYY